MRVGQAVSVTGAHASLQSRSGTTVAGEAALRRAKSFLQDATFAHAGVDEFGLPRTGRKTSANRISSHWPTTPSDRASWDALLDK